jgi:TRAP-type C4-dicarboxylate transport system permease small subunit
MTFVDRILIVISSIIVALMVLLMNAEVFLRYALTTSTKISEEYSGYMFAATTMLAFFPALRRGRFLRITAVLSLLPLRARALWELVIGALSAAFCFVLAWQTWELFVTSREFGSVSEQYSATPLMYPQIILPVALLALAIGMIFRGVELAGALWRGNTKLVKEEDNVME